MTAPGMPALPVRVTGEFPVQRAPMPKPAPCVVVILGAAGDLAHRKLQPALFNLFLDGGMPDEFAIVGVERDKAQDDEKFRATVHEALTRADIDPDALAKHWEEFSRRLFYVAADLSETAGYAEIRRRLVEVDKTVPGLQGHLFHLALPPSLYPSVIRQLAASDLVEKQRDPLERPWTRVVIEKPFGHDGESAQALQRSARRVMAEHQLYRIDPDALAKHWEEFSRRMFYVAADLSETAGYAEIRRRLVEVDKTVPGLQGHLFHLALPPSLYPSVIRQLAASDLVEKQRDPLERPWTRVVIEKPFGHDGESAQALQRSARRVMAEHQLYRIDHYLGKETVQNLLVLRFANSIFETVWNRHYIEQVQITASESLGVEHRAKYYEEAGIIRDMFQNHLLQLLTLAAMEPPTAFNADAVRDEKVKVLRAICPVKPDAAVRGQYGPGVVDGVKVIGYRQEENVANKSPTPTYAAMRFEVDNWRWHGVPFYVRAGKRLGATATEIAIRFRRPPLMLFPPEAGETLEPNILVARIQPQEGIALRFDVKVPGMAMQARSVQMNFGYAEGFGTKDHDAYETLLLDAMLGDQTLFMRSDEVEAAWGIVDPLLAYWEAQAPERFPNYAAGSDGPAAADALIAREPGGHWRDIG